MNKKVIRFFIVLAVFVLVLMVFQAVRFGGLTGFVIVSSGPGDGQTTIMLQDADSDNLGDAYTRGASANGNFGISENLEVKKISAKKRSYIKFNLSAVPDNSVIENSSLCLYLWNDQGSQNISVHRVYSDFDEMLITHNNQPCGVNFDNATNCNLTAESIAITTKNLDGSWLCWNVTNSVGTEYGLDSESVRLALYTDGAGSADKFYSKEYAANASFRPYLNITYSAVNTAPVVGIVYPSDGLNISDNSSISLNFTVSDSNLDSCWYGIDYGVNVSLASCANSSFILANGTYAISVYANDTFGLVGSNSLNFTVNNSYTKEVEGPEDSGSSGGGGGSSSRSSSSSGSVVVMPSEPEPEVIEEPKSFEFKIVDYVKLGNMFRIYYSMNREDIGKEVFVNYEINNLDGDSLVLGSDSAVIDSSGEYILEIDLPSRSFGEFNIRFLLSDGDSDEEIVEKVYLPFRGISGFTAESRFGNFSLVGTIVVSVLALGLIVMFLYRYHKRVSKEPRGRRRFINLDFLSG